MRIEQILELVKDFDMSLLLKCYISECSLESRVYLVGQVHPNTPGVELGLREPELREKDLGTFVRELKTFSDKFLKSDFLITYDIDVTSEEYETRYYKLTDIEVRSGEVVLISSSGEISELLISD